MFILLFENKYGCILFHKQKLFFDNTTLICIKECVGGMCSVWESQISKRKFKYAQHNVIIFTNTLCLYNLSIYNSMSLQQEQDWNAR